MGNGLREGSPPRVVVIAPLRRPYGRRGSLCVRCCIRFCYPLHLLSQKFAEEGVIELVSTSPGANQ